MGEEMEIGCARPTGGPVGDNVAEVPEETTTIKEAQAMVRVGKKAPDFSAPGYHKGKEATPSGWKPGKLTLKPGPGLVGKVWEVWKTNMAFD